ncbi:MAG: hypothetical protein V1929_00100 [bacterium]
MKNEIDIVRDISEKFEALGLPYMLTGSVAMNYYAEPRMTRDIDVVVAIAADNESALVDAFSRDYYISQEAVREAITYESMFNVIHLESVIKVDCVVRKAAEYRRVEFERRRRIEIGSFHTFIVSKEDLILSKLCWAKDSESEMQLRDVANLLVSGYDQHYVRTWAEKLGVKHLLERLLNAGYGG